MPIHTLDLAGTWELCGFDGYGETLNSVRLPPALENQLWIPATVPGSVYRDLMRAGWLPDIYAGCNTLAARWVEQQFWFYRRRFDAGELCTPRPSGARLPAAGRVALIGGRMDLVLEGLDLDAHVYLNGEHVGEHHNVFRPLRLDVTHKLRPGDNELIVCVSSGLLEHADDRGGDYNAEITAAVTKRALLRKPQFACRWDWAPRLMNVGLGGSVRIEHVAVARLDSIVVTSELSDDHTHARLHVRAQVDNATAGPVTLGLRAACTACATPRADTFAAPLPRHTDEALSGPNAGDAWPQRVADGAGAEAAPRPAVIAATPQQRVAPGTHVLTATLDIPNPRLWWPRPAGEPHLYDVEVALVTDSAAPDVLDTWRGRTGVRRVALRQDPAPEGGRYFHIVINGQPIFCKGANWVPADLLYSTVTPADHQALVALAVECGCNLLRIWGGGTYADHALLDACDAAGILVWHDLIFACAMAPADRPGFVAEVTQEVRYQARRLAHHPSLVVWCGNNEVDVGVQDGWIAPHAAGPASDALSVEPACDAVRVGPAASRSLPAHDCPWGTDAAQQGEGQRSQETAQTPVLQAPPGPQRRPRPCRDFFHRTLAELLATEDPTRPYWPTSPWSPDGSHPDNPRIGDQHPWSVALHGARGDYWAYRHDASRFPNEGGMLGPSTFKTLRQILPEGERCIGSRTWLHHDNTQNTWKPEPLLDHLLRVNFCDQPRQLSFHDYIRYSGLLHGEALETGIDNWRRRKFASSAAIFWMFNDTWPATVSWTPIDYYRRRKPAFWYVKRAFAPLRAICVALEDTGELAVFVVNDRLTPARAWLRYGLFALAGGRPVDERVELLCPANAAVVAARLPLATWDELGVQTHGAFAMLSSTSASGAEGAVGASPTVPSVQRLFRARFKELVWPTAQVSVTRVGAHVRFASAAFAWAVCIDPEGETALPDNYFDLLPGVAHELPWPADRPLPTAVAANPR